MIMGKIEIDSRRKKTKNGYILSSMCCVVQELKTKLQTNFNIPATNSQGALQLVRATADWVDRSLRSPLSVRVFWPLRVPNTTTLVPFVSGPHHLLFQVPPKRNGKSGLNGSRHLPASNLVLGRLWVIVFGGALRRRVPHRRPIMAVRPS